MTSSPARGPAPPDARSASPRSFRRAGSSDAVGSSSSSSGGSTASARAMATRCASPPDSSRGKASARWPTPSCSSSACARALGVGAATPCDVHRRERHVVDRRQMLEEVVKLEHHADLRRPRTLRPAIQRVPRDAGESTARRMVVLPEPDSPIRATISPSSRVGRRLSGSRASRAPAGGRGRVRARGHGVGSLPSRFEPPRQVPSGSDIAR